MTSIFPEHTQEVAVNRTGLVEAVADQTGLDRKQAEAAVKAFADVVIAETKSGEKVSVFGFGTFTPTSRAARIGRNPQTNTPVKIAASKGVRFAPASAFKETLNTKKAASRKAAAKKTTASKATAKSTAKKTTASKATAKSTAKKTGASKATAKSTPAAKTSAKRATAKTVAPANKVASTRRSSVKAAPARSAGKTTKAAGGRAPATTVVVKRPSMTKRASAAAKIVGTGSRRTSKG